MTTTEMNSAMVTARGRLAALGLVIALWSAGVVGIAWWLLQERLADYRQRTLVTAGVRLSGVKDTLAISFRQLAALPLDLAHRPAVPALLTSRHDALAETPPADVQQMLDRVGSDFALPLVALIDRNGSFALNRSAGRPAPAGLPASLATREYFINAMAHGASMQFLLGRSTRVPGLYFANRVENSGVAVGVVVVKQDTETLNRLLADADGSMILVTDSNGVVVLANHASALLQRLPGIAARPDVDWNGIYQGKPAELPWATSRVTESGRVVTISEVSGTRHVTLSSTLGDLPFRAWVLAPLDEEAALVAGLRNGSVLVWLAGCLLIWLSWRRLQLLDAALRARREIVELAQALPLTVFRYQQPLRGKAYFAFVGRGVEELLGLAPQAIEQDPELPWRLADGGHRPPTHPQEFMVMRGDNAAWLLADSSPTLEADGSTTYNGYWLDISARRETQARFAAVFEHSSTSYLFFDAQRGITHCNPATLELFRAPDSNRLLGRIPWFPDLSPELQPDGTPSRQRAIEHLREHNRTRERVKPRDWRFRRLDGSEFDAEVSVIALEWQGIPQFCAVIRDVTARKQVQAAMEEARAAAEAASQTKSSFLANMSHELRTPMNAIIGMTHLALDDGLPAKQRDYVEKAHASARNLLQILNDILDVSKIEAGQMELERIDFELESVVSDMADVLGLKADEKGLELLFSAAPNLPTRLVGDPTRLRQVLVNLGGNAIKFTERGEITVGMRAEPGEDGSVVLHGWVRDTGPGLPAGDIERLFQPFTQADSSTTRRFGGTGLGLVISRQLVERMGGKLWVDSTPGQGSIFHFSARFGRSTPRAPARAWMAGELRGRRALLVDDNAAALDVLADMLSALGVGVDRATSGPEALSLLEQAPGAYTWFLLDWKMPGMDGVEVARQIIARHPDQHPCILLVTAFARDEALRASAGLPLAGVLHKPVTPSSLHDCLVQARRSEPARMQVRRNAAAPQVADDVRQRLAGARILVAEDHPLNQELARELLRRAGMEVVVAVDGRDALKKLESDGPFDGVLMDCQMPVMDGYSATRELRANPKWKNLPVIAMTASALVEDRERALASGMNAHITKPIHVELMLRTMADWISPRGAPPGVPAVVAPPSPLAAVSATLGRAIDRVEGLAYCMGNDELYKRLLRGFRDAKTSFVAELQAALAADDWNQAARRAHDLKGLSGTIGAHRLQAAAESLRTALVAHEVERSAAELLRVGHELPPVLTEIEQLLR